MNLVNEFVLNAPRADVWAGLTNPDIAAPCMPGTVLTERIGDTCFKATVSLKVGPVKLQFLGEGELLNLASDQSYGEVLAKGSDSKGRGSFKAEMKFNLSEEDASKTRGKSGDRTYPNRIRCAVRQRRWHCQRDCLATYI